MASTSSDSSPVLSALSSDLDKTFVKGGLAEDFKHFLDESVSSTESDEDKLVLSKRHGRGSLKQGKFESASSGKSWLKAKPDVKLAHSSDILGHISKPSITVTEKNPKEDIKPTDSKEEQKNIVLRIPQPQLSHDESDQSNDEDDEIVEEIEPTDEGRWPLERALSNITEVTEGTEETSDNDPIKSSVSNEPYSEKFESSEEGESGNEFDFEFGNVNSEGESVDTEIPDIITGINLQTEDIRQLSSPDFSTDEDSSEKPDLNDSETSDSLNTNDSPQSETLSTNQNSKLNKNSHTFESFSFRKEKESGIAKPIELKERDIAKPIELKESGISKPIEIKESGISKPIEIKESGISKPIEIKESGISKPIEIKESGIAKPIEIKESGISKPIEIKESGISKLIEIKEIGISKPIEIKESGISKPIEIKESGISKPIEIKESGIAKPIEIKESGISKPIEIKESGISKPIEIKESGISKPIEIKESGISKPIEIKESGISKPIEIKESEIAKPIEEKKSAVNKPLTKESGIAKPIKIEELSISKPKEIKKSSISQIPIEIESIKLNQLQTSVPKKSATNINPKLVRSKSENILKSKPSTSVSYIKTTKNAKDTPQRIAKSQKPLDTARNFKTPKKFENTVFARLTTKPILSTSSTSNEIATITLKERETKIRSDLLLTQFQKLKKDHQHLEYLMKGYEEENIKLNDEVKKLKVSSKNAQSHLLNQKQMSSFQLASLKEKVELLESRKIEPEKSSGQNLKTPPGLEVENNKLKSRIEETELINQKLMKNIEKVSEENDKLKNLEDCQNVLKLKINHLEKQLNIEQHKVTQLQKEVDETNKQLLFYQRLQSTQGPLTALENDIKNLFSEFEKKDSMTKDTIKLLQDHHVALKQAYSQVILQLENQHIKFDHLEYASKKVGCNMILEKPFTKSVHTQYQETHDEDTNHQHQIMSHELNELLKTFKTSPWLDKRYAETESLNLIQNLESEKLRCKMLEQQFIDKENENIILIKENRSLKSVSQRLNQKIENALSDKPDELYIFLVLEKKIEELEKMYDERDSELSSLRHQLQEYTPSYVKEELQRTQELVIDKNRQLEQVRLELDSLIGLLHKVMIN